MSIIKTIITNIELTKFNLHIFNVVSVLQKIKEHVVTMTGGSNYDSFKGVAASKYTGRT